MSNWNYLANLNPSKAGFKRNQFSRIQMLVFIISFSLLGIIIWRSFAAPNPNLPGDLNGDNVVDSADLAIMVVNFQTSFAGADINQDGIVNGADFSTLLANYGRSISAAKPAIPAGLAATAGDTSVSLNWSANPAGDSVDTYQVYWSTDSAFGGFSQNLSVSGTSFNVTGLTNGTVYYFRVSAHNAAGYSSWTATPISATPQAAGGGGGGGGTGTIIKFGSYDNANFSDFSDTSCHGGSNVAVHAGGGPNNTNWARFSANSSTQCYSDTSNIRVHLLGIPGGNPSWFNLGGTFWEAVSLRIPSGFENSNNTNDGLYAGPEIHGENGSGSAPLNVTADGGYWIIRIRGSNFPTPNPSGGYPFAQYTLGGNNPGGLFGGQYFRQWQAWNGGNLAVTPDQWVNFKLGFHFDTTDNSGAGNGWFEAWARWGSMTSWVNIVPRISNIPLGYPDIDNNGTPIYPMSSLYRPTSGATGTYAIDFADGAFSNDQTTLANWQDSRLGF